MDIQKFTAWKTPPSSEGDFPLKVKFLPAGTRVSPGLSDGGADAKKWIDVVPRAGGRCLEPEGSA